jgi:hypothetical protein
MTAFLFLGRKLFLKWFYIQFITKFKTFLHIKRQVISTVKWYLQSSDIYSQVISTHIYTTGLEIFSTMKVKITFFWDVTPCSLVPCNQRIGVTRCVHPECTCLSIYSLFAGITLHPTRMHWPAIRNFPLPLTHTSFNKRGIMTSRKL